MEKRFLTHASVPNFLTHASIPNFLTYASVPNPYASVPNFSFTVIHYLVCPQAQVDADNANVTSKLDDVNSLLTATLAVQANISAAVSAASSLLNLEVSNLNQVIHSASLTASLVLQGFAIENP